MRMNELYKCGICGVVSEEKEQMCDAESLRGQEDFCLEDHSSANMCHEMKQQAAYVCDACGRPSDQPGHLCEPRRSD